MRSVVGGLVVAAAFVLVVATWQHPSAPQFPASMPAPAVSPRPTLAANTPTSLPTPPTLTAGCDEIDELFARMFVGLTEAALTESGTRPEELVAEMAAGRETLRRYLAVLDIPIDETWLDTVMNPDLDHQLLGQCLDGSSDGETPRATR